MGDTPVSLTLWSSTGLHRVAQNRAKWHRLATKPPFAIGKLFLQQPRGDTRATPEDHRLAIARRNAEIKERRVIFAANANANADTPTNTPRLDTTHSEISGALRGGTTQRKLTTPDSPKRLQRQTTHTHTQAPRDTRACPHHPCTL
jgi:hypothetical protein